MLATALSFLATILTLAYYLIAAIQTRASAAAKNKSQDRMYGFLPVLATYLNTLLWFKYGFILGDVAMTVVNGFGMTLATYSAFIYHRNTQYKQETEWLALGGLALGFLWLVAIQNGALTLDWVGLSAMLGSIVMYAMPLASLIEAAQRIFGRSKPAFNGTIGKMAQAQSIWEQRDGISLGMVLVTMGVSGTWAAYGWILSDQYVFIPNGLGLLLSGLQFVLWMHSIEKEPSSLPSLSTVPSFYSNSHPDQQNDPLLLFHQLRHKKTIELQRI